MTPLLDINGAAQCLGISKRSMERLIANDEIEVVRLPGVRKLLFRPEDLEKLVKESRVVPDFVPGTGRSLSVVGGGRRSR